MGVNKRQGLGKGIKIKDVIRGGVMHPRPTALLREAPVLPGLFLLSYRTNPKQSFPSTAEYDKKAPWPTVDAEGKTLKKLNLTRHKFSGIMTL